ncbi:PLP-dependent aminotransferase family protein [Kribbella sp. NPDC056861]|uniref:aminotransferase-like domain-containing protein n=1 Tax=Kribbella sp. NPDC056861 TaxID=3154857 RepID=UPI003425FDDD
MVIRTDHLKRRAADLRHDPMVGLFAASLRRPGMVSFAAGAPDAALLPIDDLAGFVAAARERHGPALLQYGATAGFKPLLLATDRLLRVRGLVGGAGRIHIATGGSGALNAIAMAVLRPGDRVLVETPTYAGALAVFAAYGVEVAAVETDDDGMLPVALAREITRGRVSMVYLLPTFQNPSGRTISLDRRAELAEVLVRHEVLAVEDDVYYDLRYRGPAVPALASFAPDNVAYVTSLSKTLAPALRIGITSMPPALLEVVLSLKQGIDMQTSTLAQAIAVEMLEDHWYEAQLGRLRAVYGAKLAALRSSLNAFPSGFRWTRPEGGIFAWGEGPAGFDAARLLPQAMDAGAMYVPGESFHADGGHRNTLRLSIASPSIGQIHRGVTALAAVFGGAL